MAFTLPDLAAIDAAIASGVLTVRHADGRLLTYRSTAELIQARNLVARELATPATPGALRPGTPRHLLADFSD